MLAVYGVVLLAALVGAFSEVESDEAAQQESSLEPGSGSEDPTTDTEQPAPSVITESPQTEPTLPATTLPATTAPAATLPDTTVPAATLPDATVPATTLPATAPAATADAATGPGSATVDASLSEGAVEELLRRLEALPVQPEQRSGYDRDLFDQWIDADGDGCDTRREVLIAEAAIRPRVGASCSLSGGQWYSVYDGATETGRGSGFDVDHLVPLAEAWDSGAYAWDRETRRRYANDLGYAHSLVAVSASSNRRKGADDPSEWLPPDRSVRCWYAESWIAVKARWELSVDEGEVRALRELVSQCEDFRLGSAPAGASPVSAPPTTAPVSTTASTTVAAADDPEDLCHPAYIPCLPNLPGDAINCGDLSSAEKPVQVRTVGVDPYRLDRDRDGRGCTS